MGPIRDITYPHSTEIHKRYFQQQKLSFQITQNFHVRYTILEGTIIQ